MPWQDRIKRNFKLRDLDILMVVLQTGAMARAAAQLHMSQPAVSKAIAALEHTLGVRLLHRGRRGVEATPYGTVLVQHGFAMFDELRRSVEDIEFISDPAEGRFGSGQRSRLPPLSFRRLWVRCRNSIRK